jgi:hypothetical protein
MKKMLMLILTVLIVLFLQSCPIDFGCSFSIINHSKDTIYVCFATHNVIDSVKNGIGLRRISEKMLDKSGYITLYSNDIVPTDSTIVYAEPVRCTELFYNNIDNKGYFFIIKLETVREYTWAEIRKNGLYETLIVTRKMLEENDWKIDYYPEERK